MTSEKAEERDQILYKLGERVKELTALHRTARILQDDLRPVDDVMLEITSLLPDAWQYPEVTGARIRFHDSEYKTPNFRETAWVQKAAFTTRTGEAGSLEICYLTEKPEASEGPFLAEERDLIESLAEMLRSYFQHKIADEALQQAHDNLEQLVYARTVELRKANEALQKQIAEYRVAQAKIDKHQRQLRQLASELSLAEDRERRDIASDLHDHIGQALAFIKVRLQQFHGDAMFSGFEKSIEEVVSLVEQTITYTRSLTFEISPPVLYELGLEAAVEWLGEQFQQKYDIAVKVDGDGDSLPLDTDIQVMLFKSIRELIMNTVKHAEAREVLVRLRRSDDAVRAEVVDNGKGFDSSMLDTATGESVGFGLFSIRERLTYLGGELLVVSSPGNGTEVRLTVPTGMKG